MKYQGNPSDHGGDYMQTAEFGISSFPGAGKTTGHPYLDKHWKTLVLINI